jgi:hypothetical protein
MNVYFIYLFEKIKNIYKIRSLVSIYERAHLLRYDSEFVFYKPGLDNDHDDDYDDDNDKKILHIVVINTLYFHFFYTIHGKRHFPLW